MPSAPLPANEAERLEALRSLELLDTLPESDYDDLTELAAFVCGTPMAVISLVDAERQWFKSRVGLDVPQTPREVAFCAHAILDQQLLEVPDATLDARFSDNPLVTGDFHLRFYAGVPLVDEKGHALGTICVLDTERRALDDSQRTALEALGRQVMRLFTLRATTRAMEQRNEALDRNAAWFRAVIESAASALIMTDTRFRVQGINQYAAAMLHLDENAAVGRVSLSDLLAGHAGGPSPDVWAKLETQLRQHGEVRALETSLVDARGMSVPVSLNISPIRGQSASGPEAAGYLIMAEDIRERLAEREHGLMTAQIDAMVLDAQQHCIDGVQVELIMRRLLDRVLEICHCEYGFIGEVLTDDIGLHLHTFAITDIAWDDASRQLYDDNIDSGMIFRNHKTLFGHVMTSGSALISNDPYHDPRRGGLPPGHPRMDAFCGLPMYFGKDMVGMIGLANRPGGFDREFIDRMQPLMRACGSIVSATRLAQERQEAIEALTDQQERVAAILYSADDSYVEVDAEGRLLDWNEAATDALKLSPNLSGGVPLGELMMLQDGDGAAIDLQTLPGRSSRDHAWVGEVRFPGGGGFPVEVLAWRQKGVASASTFAFLRDITSRLELEEQARRRFQTETLLKEVHHRVKNNMQVISSMLGIQSAKVRRKEDRAVFQGCRERIRAMAAIHERLYATGRYDRIEFSDYLQEVVPMLVSSNSPPDCRIDARVYAERSYVNVDDAVPLSLILAEAILNSTKHAFVGRAKGTIEVKLYRESANLVLEIGDDGQGTPDIEQHEGTGLVLIRSLVKQIRGSLQFRSHEAAGTRLRVAWFCAPGEPSSNGALNS